MEKTIISRENIKPSSPTPSHLKTYTGSILDQTSVPILIPFVLYFLPRTINGDDFISLTTEQLKRSLSLVLTRFYPFAGRANDDGESIDCNDAGADFTVARFSGHRLLDILKNPSQDLPDHLLPADLVSDGEKDWLSRVVAIQVNYFDCGGVAVGTLFWHRAADITTMVDFVQAWASVNRGSKLGFCPNYISRILFPHKEDFNYDPFAMIGSLRTGKWASRRYVFDSPSIESLKTKTGLENPTRVEAVSALIWKCFMAASLANGKSTSAMSHAVNLRGRFRPPFPSNCFGNFFGNSVAFIRNDNGVEYKDLARKLRDSIRKIDEDYVSRLQGDGRRSISGDVGGAEADILGVTSWCRMGIYDDIDFGWGKPVWTTAYCNGSCDETSRYVNLVWLMDSRVGGGIEARVLLGEGYMAVFDAIDELRDLASVEPSPVFGIAD
ncbi:stemmadenine O-acetyltransferase-like [Andrographis paniculata]|uniref:stemmadenine O-acetyltransferase-like n=1 Tax=Andrographis paniculata TaxID=175694 RepID=UPI0021E7131D|nr:stemmadenine O-acetyltransferase-like [Andrographis paniculata]